MREFVCGEHIKDMWQFAHVHRSQICYAHNGLNDICILCIQNRSPFIGIHDQRCYYHCRSKLQLCIKQPRELKFISNVFKSFYIIKRYTWTIILYGITSYVGRYFDYCRGVMNCCQVSWCCWFGGTRWRSQRRWGAICQWHFCADFKKVNVVSAVCTRHSRDALWWFKRNLNLSWPMFLEFLKLWCPIWNGLEGSQTGRNTFLWE